MKGMFTNKLILAVLLAFAAAALPAHAQRAGAATEPRATTTTQTTAAVSPAPQTFKAKYEGGVFGYNRKIEGMMTFDDGGNRLVFRDKAGQTLFVIPYSAISAAFADTQSRRPTATRVIAGTVPYGLGLPALLFKKKHRYLTLQYRDAETENVGTTSFKVGNSQLLTSVLNGVGAKAGLARRGEIFVRPRNGEQPSTGVYEVATPPQND